MTISRFQLTAVYREVESGWVQANIAELPGVITAAPTRNEAAELLHDALRQYILAVPASQPADVPPGSATGERDVLEIADSS